MLNTAQVAERLGISPQRVRALISSGTIPAERVGRDWVIREEDLLALPERKPGRPRGYSPKRL